MGIRAKEALRLELRCRDSLSRRSVSLEMNRIIHGQLKLVDAALRRLDIGEYCRTAPSGIRSDSPPEPEIVIGARHNQRFGVAAHMPHAARTTVGPGRR